MSAADIVVIAGLIFWVCVMIWLAQFVFEAVRLLIDRRRDRRSAAESVERSLRGW